MQMLRILAIFAFAFAAAPALAESPAITVEGVGQASAAPDLATIRIGVESQAKTAPEALAANNADAQSLIDEAKAQGVDPADIQTADFSIYPVYDNRRPPNGEAPQAPELVGYRVSNTVVLRLRDIAKIGETLGALVGAGANRINQISFDVADDAALGDEARRAAVADATRKAELYAAAAGLALGPITSIEESGAGRPVPFAAARGAAMAEAVPVEAGESAVSARVRIVWSLRAAD